MHGTQRWVWEGVSCWQWVGVLCPGAVRWSTVAPGSFRAVLPNVPRVGAEGCAAELTAKEREQGEHGTDLGAPGRQGRAEGRTQRGGPAWLHLPQPLRAGWDAPVKCFPSLSLRFVPLWERGAPSTEGAARGWRWGHSSSRCQQLLAKGHGMGWGRGGRGGDGPSGEGCRGRGGQRADSCRWGQYPWSPLSPCPHIPPSPLSHIPPPSRPHNPQPRRPRTHPADALDAGQTPPLSLQPDLVAGAPEQVHLLQQHRQPLTVSTGTTG